MSPSKFCTVAVQRFSSVSSHVVLAFVLLECTFFIGGMQRVNFLRVLNNSITSCVRAELPPTSLEEESVSSGVYLPSERLRERQFDQAQRLIAAGRMADATALLDEMLTAEQDVFLEAG